MIFDFLDDAIDAFKSFREEERKAKSTVDATEIRHRFVNRLKELTPDWLKEAYREIESEF